MSSGGEKEKPAGVRMAPPVIEAEPSSSSPTAAVAATKDKDDEDSRRPPRSPSPEPRHCSICLQDLVNKSYSNTCIHEFCFGCLLEWSKVKPECPLCKASFRSIYHNIRSNSDYDEYVVPTPIPHLSIRLTTTDRFSPEVIVTRGSSNLGNHDYSLPEFRFGGPSQRNVARSREVAHAIMRDRLRDPRVIRILQWTPYGDNSQSRSESIEMTLHGQALPNDNPFTSDTTPELFGTAIDLANDASAAGANFSGYQSRRRRYDRNQWVSPFDSTLQAGTVFFPSVEYFQRHPSAIRRIGPWLHRELTVLLSLNHSRPQMAFTYDLIISLLSRHDIRSREFRDLILLYFGSKTKHFQHEFYHYVLSGMRMEEYDRIAQYGNTGNSASIQSASFDDNPASREPTVVTLDSDDENEGQIEIILSDDDDSNTNAVDESRINRAFRGRGEDWLDELIQSIPSFPSPISSPRLSRSQSTFPADLSDSLEPFNPVEIMERNVGNRRESRFDPEMPILEPQVDLNNLSSTAGSSGSAFRRTRNSDPPTTTASTSGRYSRATETIGLLNSLRDIYMHPERHSVQDVRGMSSGHRDPIDGRRSPYPQPSIFSPQPGTESSVSDVRPLASPDSSIFDYFRRQRHRQDEPAQRSYREGSGLDSHHGDLLSNIDGRFQEAYRNRLRSYSVRTNIPASSPLNRPVENSGYSIPERSSCIHNRSTGSSAQVRIIPSPMDLTTNNSSSSSRSNQNKSVIQSRPRTPGRPPSPLPFGNHRAVNQTKKDEGECEFLGVHPVVKKPPLAVITLSSDDEDRERGFKNERMDSLATETVERDVFMELFNTSFDPDPPLISSLNAENLIDSHLASTSGTSYAYQMSDRLPYPPHKVSLRSSSRFLNENKDKMDSMAIPPPQANYDFMDAFPPPIGLPQASVTAANVIESSSRNSSSIKKKSKRRARGERDSRKSRSDSRKSQGQASLDVSLELGKRKNRQHQLWSKSRSRSSSGDSSSTASECDYESRASTSRRKCKPPKKKKSKKSRRSKSKSTKKDNETPQVAKSSGLDVGPSTSGINSKLKSVVVKVAKPKKIKKSRVLIYTTDSSSEDNDYDTYPKPASVRLSFSKIEKDCKRLRSVIASTSGSITSSPMTVSSSDAHTAATAALDLRNSSHSQSLSPATVLPQPVSFRRWESDDDEPKNDEDNTSFEAETLLSVGYEDPSRSSGSETDTHDSPKASTVWGMARKRLTSAFSDNSSQFLNEDRDDSSILFSGTSGRLSPVHGTLNLEGDDLPLLNSNSPEHLDRFDNTLINGHEVRSDSSSNELRSLSPPLLECPERLERHRHHYDVNISYPERAHDDLLDLTVTVTRSRTPTPSTSPVPPVRLWW